MGVREVGGANRGRALLIHTGIVVDGSDSLIMKIAGHRNFVGKRGFHPPNIIASIFDRTYSLNVFNLDPSVISQTYFSVVTRQSHQTCILHSVDYYLLDFSRRRHEPVNPCKSELINKRVAMCNMQRQSSLACFCNFLKTICGVEIKCLAIVLCVFLTPTAFADGDDDDDEHEAPEQDFLFLLDEAYTQEEGELQLDFSVDVATDLTEEEGAFESSADETTYSLAFEYGITDNLTVEAEIPFISYEVEVGAEEVDESGIGDIEIELAYQFVRESAGTPALAFSIGVAAPTGDHEKGLGTDTWGYELALNLSRNFADDWFFHANLGYEQVNDAKEGDDEEVDETELYYGFALAFEATHSSTILLEYLGIEEEEDEDGETEEEESGYVSLGYVYETESELELGLAYAGGTTDESFDNRLIFKLAYEW